MATVYMITAKVRTADTLAAADACNRELMATGEALSREAAEAKIAECAPSLREWLAVEAEEEDDE